MKQLIVLVVFAISIFTAQADVPGKATNHGNKVTLQNVAALKDYTLYWHKHYEDTTITVSSDTSLIIPGSAGAPDGANFWGINKKTGKSTDTIQLSNYYDPDYVLIFSGIQGDSIRYSKQQLSNANTIVDTDNKDSIANKQLVLDAEKIKQNNTLKNVLLGAATAIALGGLAWFFINRRKKKKEATANKA